jgi:hypothetical protein
MDEEAVRFHLIGNGVCLSALDTDLGIVQATRTAPPGVMYIEVTHDDGREGGLEVGE